jgi:hypothetical protein
MPLAGRPPFATDDEGDSVYAGIEPQTRYQPPPRDDPNARTSAYNQYVLLFSPASSNHLSIFS